MHEASSHDDVIAWHRSEALRARAAHAVSFHVQPGFKVMRRVIRATYLGEDPGDITALEKPIGARRDSGERPITINLRRASRSTTFRPYR